MSFQICERLIRICIKRKIDTYWQRWPSIPIGVECNWKRLIKMIFDQPKPKDNKQIESINCFGRGCNNVATHYLTIAFIGKRAWLCSSCKVDLENDGLVDCE